MAAGRRAHGAARGGERGPAGAGADGGAVRCETAGAVLRIVLDRPPLNVLDAAMMERLADAVASASRSRAKVVLLTGAGRAFCAGVDVAEHTADRVEAMIRSFHRVIAALLASDRPVVAAVNGVAVGGGFELALACDVVLFRSGARVGQPEVGLGVFPPAAAALLPRLIGRQRALDLILSGRTLTAEEAFDLGLGSRVLGVDDFAERAAAYAAGLAAHSGPVLRLARRAVLDGLESPLADALESADRAYLTELMALRDPHEGLAAFLEKRAPAWSDA